MQDICFTNGSNWFRYRAAAIILEEGHLLFAGNEAEDYLYSIGGAVHMGETAEDAVVREVLEETGVRYEIDRLAVIHENFFADSGVAHKDLNCHEISFYFLMKPRGSRQLCSNSTTAGGIREFMRWIPVQDIKKFKAYPSFLEEYLKEDRPGIVHIVTDER